VRTLLIVVRVNLKKSLFILPNLFTLSSVFCGFYAIRLCAGTPSDDEFYRAAMLIIFAMFFDTIDGRVARLTRTQSAFGLQLDSLADVISFGMAPAILSFAWGLHPLGRLGWAAGFLFVAAAAVRLARFNIQSTSHQDKRYFVGMPSPPAAGVPAATVFAFPMGLTGPWEAAAVLAMVIVPALLMVSTVRFRSFKTFDLHSRRSYPALLIIALGLAALAARPEEVLLVAAYAYLASAFVGMAWTRLRRRAAAPPPQAG